MPLDYDDRTDFENAERGLIDKLDPCIIKDADGKVVWDLEAYSYLDGERPETVHPSLWRQAQLLKIQGLFEVTEGIYQVRGFDLSNITFVEGDTGVIVIDPLISAETAAAALALYRKNRGDRPVTARDLHPLARRPLRRGQGHPARRRRRRADHRAGRLPRARGLGERVRRGRDEPAGGVHVRLDPGALGHRPGRAPDWDWRPPRAPLGLLAPTVDITAHRARST